MFVLTKDGAILTVTSFHGQPVELTASISIPYEPVVQRNPLIR